jgi:signal transduction histidine kinase
VRVGTDRGGIVVEVVDDGHGDKGVESASGRQSIDSDRSGRPDRSGRGIVGMRERALLLGGTLDARSLPGGGFRVVAHLPTEGERA